MCCRCPLIACSTYTYYYHHHIYYNTTTMAATDQIRQMVNFILQEAHEKANEIRVKVRRWRSESCVYAYMYLYIYTVVGGRANAQLEKKRAACEAVGVDGC